LLTTQLSPRENNHHFINNSLLGRH